jgi:hypothetical protein
VQVRSMTISPQHPPATSALLPQRRRALPAPPSVADPVSRRETAVLLGFGSDFKVRQLEKQGLLRPVRGAMGQAWYARAQVLTVAEQISASLPRRERPAAASSAGGPWSDAALLAHLRMVRGAAPSVVDLVVDTGISIARAEKVYRFWIAHDRHPAAENARAGGGGGKEPRLRLSPGPLREPSPPEQPAEPVAVSGPDGASPVERRGRIRLGRDALIRQLRDPDPALRAQAFRRLRADQRGFLAAQTPPAKPT